ncbi:hypothetical protein KEM56_001505 [Ascosphaera pollenicola]|nr:hypothetical protein KEM56_001505 [Ascosphaera pollenicola]
MEAEMLMRKRRTMGLADADIEQQIDTRIPYRTGWPKLPVLHTWTCQEGNPMKYIPNYDKIVDRVKTILRKRNLPSRDIMACHRLPYGVEAKEANVATATLLIITDFDGGNYFLATRDIRRFLASMDIHICIEILDRRTFKLRTFAVLPSEKKLVELWTHGLRNDLINILSHSKMQWTSLSLFHRGYENTREKCPATIVIGAVDPSDSKWAKEVIPKIREKYNDDLAIEVTHQNRSSFVTTEGEEHSAGRNLNPRHFVRKIKMGTSCGAHELMESATFGGMVRLKKFKEDEGCFALSTHNGLMSDCLEKATAGGKSLSPNDKVVSQAQLRVDCPSDHDTKTILECTKTNIDDTKNVLSRERKKAKTWKNFFSTDYQAQSEIANELTFEVADLKKIRQSIESFDRRAGHLYASSGYRVRGESRCPLDWSLTKLLEARNMKNGLEGRAVPGAMTLTNMNTWRKLDFRGRTVAKFGRSSHWTQGTINSVESVFSGREFPYDGMFTCWPVVPETDTFAQPGDAGSLVLDAADRSHTQGTWLGLLMGSDTVNGIGYVTPIYAVFADIEKTTGCTIAEPTEVS